MRAKAVYILIIVVGLLASFGLARNLYQTYQNTTILDQAKKKLTVLQEENRQLLAENAEAKEPSFIERQAREVLGLVKPGEVVVILPTKEASPQAQPAADKPARSIWQQWLSLFFGG